MKAVKPFVKTCYSELLVANASAPENADEKDGGGGGAAASGKSAAAADDGGPSSPAADSMYLGGLGLKFKFPGDPKK